MRYKHKKERIARKKAWAIIKIALTIALITDGNAAVEYLKALPEQALTFKNHAQASEIEAHALDSTESDQRTAPAPEDQPEVKTATFTAYTASPDETDSDPTITASNKTIKKGMIACPRHMKFGTKIEVDGLGTYTCEDRMAKKHDGKFDIYMETKADAFTFGKRNLIYRVIE